MHVFPRYASPSPAAEVDLVRRNPFALVISDGPVATHLPVVFPQNAALPSTLVGAGMLGHMARENPHWRVFAREVLLVFASPHGYVSPSTYGHDPAVPTLNYAAVHARAAVELVEGHTATLHVVEETVRALEGLRGQPWDMTASRARFEELAPHVMAFRLRVTSATSMFKLSQDMPADIRGRVRQDLVGSCPHLVELMEESEASRTGTSGRRPS